LWTTEEQLNTTSDELIRFQEICKGQAHTIADLQNAVEAGMAENKELSEQLASERKLAQASVFLFLNNWRIISIS
jgi:hypothetical protein